jgi:hypothetical protein
MNRRSPRGTGASSKRSKPGQWRGLGGKWARPFFLQPYLAVCSQPSEPLRSAGKPRGSIFFGSKFSSCAASRRNGLSREAQTHRLLYFCGLDRLHASIENFAAEGFTRIAYDCPRCRMTRLRPIRWLPRIFAWAALSRRWECGPPCS